MSLNTETKGTLLKNLFYSPNAQFTSAKALYKQVKKHGIKNKEVKDFVQRQETTQLFKDRRGLNTTSPCMLSIGSKFYTRIVWMYGFV